MTLRYCKICDGFHALDQPWPSNCHVPVTYSRSDLPAPGIISDTMESGVQSQLDGKIYTSKSALRRTYKAANMVEVGNDPARHKPFVKPRPSRKDIKTSVQKAVARFKRGERSSPAVAN